MKILPDTNLWIAFFRNPSQREAIEARLKRPITLLSSVVAMELIAGCRTRPQKRAVAGFAQPFEKANRILTPDHEAFLEAGRVLAKIGEDGIGAAHRRQLVNDILIAVSATRAGAVVVTANTRDFAQIERHTPIRWTAA
jgi:predicted nucleic acid-binding protein